MTPPHAPLRRSLEPLTRFSSAVAAGYAQDGLWQLGISVGAPHPENREPPRLEGSRGQMACCTPHALIEVWRHHVVNHTKAKEDDLIWCTDGACFSHPTKNISDFTDRQQELIYSRSAPHGYVCMHMAWAGWHRVATHLRSPARITHEQVRAPSAHACGLPR